MAVGINPISLLCQVHHRQANIYVGYFSGLSDSIHLKCLLFLFKHLLKSVGEPYRQFKHSSSFNDDISVFSWLPVLVLHDAYSQNSFSFPNPHKML